eukprot:8392574-Pyramimonas_sp.AAC.1
MTAWIRAPAQGWEKARTTLLSCWLEDRRMARAPISVVRRTSDVRLTGPANAGPPRTLTH